MNISPFLLRVLSDECATTLEGGKFLNGVSMIRIIGNPRKSNPETYRGNSAECENYSKSPNM
jgi:hypothetical protein